MKAIEIKGFLPEKKEGKCDIPDSYRKEGYNQCRDEMSERSIGLNREKLALYIYYAENRGSMCLPFKDLDNKDKYYEMADFIISREADIVEAGK